MSKKDKTREEGEAVIERKRGKDRERHGPTGEDSEAVIERKRPRKELPNWRKKKQRLKSNVNPY